MLTWRPAARAQFLQKIWRPFFVRVVWWVFLPPILIFQAPHTSTSALWPPLGRSGTVKGAMGRCWKFWVADNSPGWDGTLIDEVNVWAWPNCNQKLRKVDWNLQQREGEFLQPLSYLSSSKAFDKERYKSSDSDEDASESESEDESDIQSQSASGGRKRVLNNHGAQMQNGKVTSWSITPMAKLQPMVWIRSLRLMMSPHVDAYKECRYKPKLRVADPASMSVLDFWDVSRFLLARALVKSFRKQTQDSNLARNALQWESCTMLWHLMSAGNAGIIGPLRALMTYFQH